MNWLIAVTISIFTTWANANEVPSVSVQQNQKVFAGPDLSFDGISFSVPLMSPEAPAGGCENLVSDLHYYKVLELMNRNYFLEYFKGVKNVLREWHTKLKVYEEQDIQFAEGTFQPMLDLIQNIKVVTGNMEKNSVMIDEYLYAYTDNFAECSENENIIGLLEIYATNFFETQSEIWRYLLEVSESVQILYNDYKKIENIENHLVAKDKFISLDKLSSDQPGLGGLGEMMELMMKAYQLYYDVEYNKFFNELNEAKNVQR